jgi:hypothetical protein
MSHIRRFCRHIRAIESSPDTFLFGCRHNQLHRRVCK